MVSEDHGLFLDGVLVPAGLLVNGQAIVREMRDAVVFSGNRRQFSNCAIGYDLTASLAEPCAETVFAGARLDAIRARLPVFA